MVEHFTAYGKQGWDLLRTRTVAAPGLIFGKGDYVENKEPKADDCWPRDTRSQFSCVLKLWNFMRSWLEEWLISLLWSTSTVILMSRGRSRYIA